MRARVGLLCKASGLLSNWKRRQRGSWLAGLGVAVEARVRPATPADRANVACTALVGIPLGVGEVGLNGEFDRVVLDGGPKRGGYNIGDAREECFVGEIDVRRQG